MDFSDAPTGIYENDIRYGLFDPKAGEYVRGKFLKDTELLPVVNLKDSPFGAGWGIEGLYQIYPSSLGALLVDGNGNEQIFLAPAEANQPYTALSQDFSTLIRRPDGTFLRSMLDGTDYEFDAEGMMVKEIDRHGNTTTYEYIDKKISRIVDPVGLETTFRYVNDLVSEIRDPAGRITRFNYDRGNLVQITDPDGSIRKFEYDALKGPREDLEPWTHLMTGEIQKRGNSQDSVPAIEFHESWSYDHGGRIEGGTRVGGDKFTLSSGQAFGAHDPNKISAPIPPRYCATSSRKPRPNPSDRKRLAKPAR